VHHEKGAISNVKHLHRTFEDENESKSFNEITSEVTLALRKYYEVIISSNLDTLILASHPTKLSMPGR